MRGRKHIYDFQSFKALREEIDNPRMRGRKHQEQWHQDQSNQEEIDNPRMRGRKLSNSHTVRAFPQRKKLIIPGWGDGNAKDRDPKVWINEEIDNPRMRGRKPYHRIVEAVLVVEEIDNPRMRGRKLIRKRLLKRSQRKKLIIPGWGDGNCDAWLAHRWSAPKKLIIPGWGDGNRTSLVNILVHLGRNW